MSILTTPWKAFIRFNRGVFNLPVHWMLWNMLLVMANLVLQLFFLNRVESQVVLATVLASMILMTTLTGLSGFSRLLGLGHVLWIPLLYFL